MVAEVIDGRTICLSEEEVDESLVDQKLYQ